MQNMMVPTNLLKIVPKVPILGHYGARNGHLGYFGQINVHEIILFLHKKVHNIPLIYHSTNSNHTLIKGAVTWPPRGQGPMAIFVEMRHTRSEIE